MLHCVGVSTQSEGSEFGDCEGKEQTSISCPPLSEGVTQHVDLVSSVRQPVPLHCVWPVFGGLGKGSSGEFGVTVHVEVQVVGVAFVQRVGRSSAHV